MHRVLLLLALLLAAGARPVRAQGGMPDMSKAPREIQAIWKKVMSGGIPTPAEAQKLQQYMSGHRDQIVAGAKASAAAAAKMADSVKGANAAAAPADATAQCPARSPALATVASVAPSPAAAARLLDSLRQSYTAQESTAGQQHLRQLMQKARTAPALDFMGSMLAAANKAGASVVVYAAAAQLGGATARASWSGLGAALELAGDDPHAVSAFRRALAIGPRAATDVYGLGVAYANMGDMATGIPLLTEATRLAPKFGMAWDALGRAQSCTGAIKIAVASMQKAQEVDWIESREAQVSGPESNDDKVEAGKPLPEPPGVALTPPPSPPPFPFQVPSIPGTWQAAKHFGTEMLGVAGEYRGMQTGIAPREQAAEDAARKEMEAAEARAGLAGAMLFDMNIDNSRDVYQATDRVDQRVAGRKSLIMASYNDQSMRLVKQAAARGAAIYEVYSNCVKAHPDDPHLACRRAWCRSSLALRTESYTAQRGVATQMMAAMADVSAAYDRVMRAWFSYANDPVAQVRVDFDRREQEIGTELYLYTTAVAFDAGDEGEELVSECNAVEQAAAAAKAAADSAAKPGKCGSKKVSVDVVVANFYLDCKELRFSALGAQFDFRDASKGRHGELFVGLGIGGLTGVAGAGIGMQANFDQSGKVSTAGLGLHGSYGNFLVGTANADETINFRSSGPDVEDQSTFTTGAAFEGDLSAFPGHFVTMQH